MAWRVDPYRFVLYVVTAIDLSDMRIAPSELLSAFILYCLPMSNPLYYRLFKLLYIQIHQE